MKTHLAFAAALLAASLTAQSGTGIWTTHVPNDDATLYGAVLHRGLYQTNDSNYADPRWHRVPGALFTLRRSYMVDHTYNPHFLNERWTTASAWRYPAEREPRYVWSRAFFEYVPYPVDYSRLILKPQREHVGYTTMIPREPVPFREPLPPIAEGALPPIGAATDR